MIVMKFGDSSIANAKRIDKVVIMQIWVLVLFMIFSPFFYSSCVTGNDNSLKNTQAFPIVTLQPDNQLDSTITQISIDVINALFAGTKIALLNTSYYDELELTDYIIENLTGSLINSKRMTIVERKDLDIILDEQSFQLSGYVDDDSAISIGKMLGADSILTCTIDGLGDLRRLRIKIMDVQSGEVQFLSLYRIITDWRDIRRPRQVVEENIVGDSTLIAGSTLLVGSIMCIGRGFTKDSNVPMNGTFTYGIELGILNIETEKEKEYTLVSKKNGLFFMVDLPEGTYKIVKFYLKLVNDKGYWSDHQTTAYRANHTFTIEKNKINNIGMIVWSIALKKEAHVTFSTSYAVVKDEFETQYRQSNWNNIKWVNIKISIE